MDTFSITKGLKPNTGIYTDMNKSAVKQLKEQGEINLDIEAQITLKIRDEYFRPGTVHVHLPAPINAAWLKEGQLLDSEPMFRMASVEDYPQRSVYFNERLERNTPFTVKYAFTSEHKYVHPDTGLIDSTVQKRFSVEEIRRFSDSHHCGCESYTALPADAVSILDVIEDRGIQFKPEYKDFMNDIGTPLPQNPAVDNKIFKNGTTAHAIYRFITENFDKMNRKDHNIAFVSMCRMCGIPARWQGGWAVSDKPESLNQDNVIKGDSESFTACAHDWAMVHLLPYGWIFVDCSYGADKFGRDFFFGNIDPCMVPTASAPGADLYPAKDYERADKVFNSYGEVELVPGKLDYDGHYEGYGLNSDQFESAIIITSNMTS